MNPKAVAIDAKCSAIGETVPEKPAGVHRSSARYMALCEQGLISGSNFVVYLLAARLLPREEWGAISLAFATILVLQGFQRAFVTLPMTTSGASMAEASQLRRLLFNCQWNVTLIAVGLATLFAWLSTVSLERWVSQSAIVTTILIGPVFYHEFARRVVITTGSMQRLLLMACVYSGVVLGVPAVLFLAKVDLSGNVLVAAIALAAVAACATSRTALFQLGSMLQGAQKTDFDLLRFGGWSAASSLAYSGYNFAVQAMLGAFAGPSALGAYAAVRTLTQPVGTLIQAIDSVDKPRAGRAFARDGMTGLWTVIRKSWVWLLVLGVPYLLGIMYFSSEVLGLAYGDRYADAQPLVFLWSSVMLVMMLTQPLETGLYVIRRPDMLFRGRALSAVIVLCATPFLVSSWGASGALAALILGWSLAGLIGAWQLRHVDLGAGT